MQQPMFLLFGTLGATVAVGSWGPNGWPHAGGTAERCTRTPSLVAPT